MKINKINYIYMILAIGIEIFIFYGVCQLTMKGYHFMNMFQVIYQVMIETNILFTSFFIHYLLNKNITNIKENFIKLFSLGLLLISPALYIGVVRSNNNIVFLSIILIIQIIVILAAYRKILSWKMMYSFITLSFICLLTFFIVKTQYYQTIKTCETTKIESKMEQCIYWLNSSQYNNGEGFLNGVKAIEVMNKNNEFKKYLEHKYSAKANIEENRIYWEPTE